MPGRCGAGSGRKDWRDRSPGGRKRFRDAEKRQVAEGGGPAHARADGRRLESAGSRRAQAASCMAAGINPRAWRYGRVRTSRHHRRSSHAHARPRRRRPRLYPPPGSLRRAIADINTLSQTPAFAVRSTKARPASVHDRRRARAQAVDGELSSASQSNPAGTAGSANKSTHSVREPALESGCQHRSRRRIYMRTARPRMASTVI